MSDNVFRTVKYFGLFPHFFHIFVNPLIYSYIDKKFREQLIKLCNTHGRNDLIQKVHEFSTQQRENGYERNGKTKVMKKKQILIHCSEKRQRLTYNFYYIALILKVFSSNYRTSWHTKLYSTTTKITLLKIQKQPYRGVLKRRCSESMQQVYKRTPMPGYDFNKVALQLY